MSGRRHEPQRVAVLMGGTSSEREISLKSGRGVVAALTRLGHAAFELECDAGFVDSLRALKPDVVFNALHGGFGEDGGVQAILEWLRLPYTGSSVLPCALAMDKHLTKKLLLAEGLPTPAWSVCDTSLVALPVIPSALHFPLVIKPRAEGSSLGVTFIHNTQAWESAVRKASDSGVTAILAEEAIVGREFTVAVLGERALPVIEIVPADAHAFYDYAAKYTPGGSRHLVPAPIDASLAERLRNLALATHHLLGLRDYSRTDFMLSADGTPQILEINALPGLTEQSLLPDAANAIGLGYDALIATLLDYAHERAKSSTTLANM